MTDLDCMSEQRLAEIYEMGYKSVEDWLLSCEIEERFDIFMDNIRIDAIRIMYNTDLLRNPGVLIKLKSDLGER